MKTLTKLIAIGCMLVAGSPALAQVSATLGDTQTTGRATDDTMATDDVMYGNVDYGNSMSIPPADCSGCNEGCNDAGCGNGNCGGRVIGGRLFCGTGAMGGNIAGRLGNVVSPWNRNCGSLNRGCPDGNFNDGLGGPGGLFTGRISQLGAVGGGIFSAGCGPTPMGSCNGFSSRLSSRFCGMLFRVGNQGPFGQQCSDGCDGNCDGACSMSFRNGRLVDGVNTIRSQINVRDRVGQVRGRVSNARGRVAGAVGRVRSIPRQIGQPACLRYISGSVGLNIWDGAVQPVGIVSNGFGGLPEFDIEESAVYRIAIGRYATDCWRTEFEASYRRLEVDETQFGTGLRQNDAFAVDGARNSTSFMFNVIRDLSPRGLVRPYLKAGLGLTYSQVNSNLTFDANDPLVYTSYGFGSPQTVSSSLPEEESTEFSWQAGGGLAFCITQNMFMDLEYQYVDIGLAESGNSNLNEGVYFGDGRGHQITIGCRMDY